MAVKRPRSIQSKSSVLMFDSPSEIRSVFKYFRVLVGFGSGSKRGGIPDHVKDGCLSPTSPLDFKGFSRFSSGVGLGILVALDTENNDEPKKAMPVVSVKLPSWNKLGKTEENHGGRLCTCKEVVFEDSARPSAFLDVCYLCRRKLSHHKDIYMYRGDRAFCSEECRNQQIMSDERKERRPSSNSSCSSSCSPVFTITPMTAALY